MNYYDFLMMCVGNQELVAEFNRLSGHELGIARTPIIKSIDDACGYDPDRTALPDFIAFVTKNIWSYCADKIVQE